MKSLATLIKLQKTRVDEKRQELARQMDILERTERAIAQLAIALVSEQQAASQNEESRATYGAWLRAAILRGKALEKERLANLAAVEAARDKLSEVFSEQKRYEQAESARLEALRKEEAHKETVTLDEVGSTRWGRK
ncbi:MAG: hypothetical protein ABTQ34_02195 [Bdellovibrionales bacterium]